MSEKQNYENPITISHTQQGKTKDESLVQNQQQELFFKEEDFNDNLPSINSSNDMKSEQKPKINREILTKDKTLEYNFDVPHNPHGPGNKFHPQPKNVTPSDYAPHNPHGPGNRFHPQPKNVTPNNYAPHNPHGPGNRFHPQPKNVTPSNYARRNPNGPGNTYIPKLNNS